jgi:dienelactone hydrolase
MVMEVVALSSVLLMASDSSVAADTPSKLVRQSTPEGVEFGIWNGISDRPAPILFVLASTIESTLGEAYYRQCGNELAEHGWVCVSIDLPCHGTQAINGEPEGLPGWSHLAGKKRDFVAQSNARLTQVLDHLIKSGIADPKYIAACGTSRGGFLAIHFAAHDKRVQCAAGFAPVTDLAALREFRAIEDSPFVRALSLETQAEQLAGRPIWIVIGDQDERVGTDLAINFARKLTAASREMKLDSRVELHVLPEPRGHTTPRGSPQRAASWILSQFPDSGRESSTTGYTD